MSLYDNEKEEQLFKRIKNQLRETIQEGRPKKIIRRYLKWQVSAAKSSKRKITQPVLIENEMKNDIAPGNNKAILTLADGFYVVLDSISNEIIGHQGIIDVKKLDNDLLS